MDQLVALQRFDVPAKAVHAMVRSMGTKESVAGHGASHAETAWLACPAQKPGCPGNRQSRIRPIIDRTWQKTSPNRRA